MDLDLKSISSQCIGQMKIGTYRDEGKQDLLISQDYETENH